MIREGRPGHALPGGRAWRKRGLATARNALPDGRASDEHGLVYWLLTHDLGGFR
jgi:hypothetical protein